MLKLESAASMGLPEYLLKWLAMDPIQEYALTIHERRLSLR